MNLVFGNPLVLDTILSNFSLIELVQKRPASCSWNESVNRILHKRSINQNEVCLQKCFQSITSSGENIINNKTVSIFWRTFLSDRYNNSGSVPPWVLCFIHDFLKWRLSWMHAPKLVILTARNNRSHFIEESDVDVLNEAVVSCIPPHCKYTYLSDEAYFVPENDDHDGCYDDDDEMWIKDKYCFDVVVFHKGVSIETFHTPFCSSYDHLVDIEQLIGFMNHLSSLKFMVFFCNTIFLSTDQLESFKRKCLEKINKSLADHHLDVVIEGCLLYSEITSIQMTCNGSSVKDSQSNSSSSVSAPKSLTNCSFFALFFAGDDISVQSLCVDDSITSFPLLKDKINQLKLDCTQNHHFKNGLAFNLLSIGRIYDWYSNNENEVLETDVFHHIFPNLPQFSWYSHYSQILFKYKSKYEDDAAQGEQDDKGEYLGSIHDNSTMFNVIQIRKK